MSPRVALVTDEPSGWHSARIHDALVARGCDVQAVALSDCAIDLVSAPRGLQIPSFDEHLPDGVFVRGVPGGTLEQVVLYLDTLHALRIEGTPVYNDGRAIERSVDKGMASLLLKRAGIPIPPTWVVSSAEYGELIWGQERVTGHRLVVKPLFGSQGRGLVRLELDDVLPALEDYQGVYYLQRFIEGQHFDWRVLVINGTAVASMQRRGTLWVNNASQGATCTPAPPDRELEELAAAATKALGMDYAGVDLMRDVDGDLKVLEVNSIPAWGKLQAVSGIDVAHQLVEDFYDRYLGHPRIMALQA